MSLDVAALLTFGALVALVFGPYFDTLGALAFLVFGAGLFVTNIGGSLRALLRWWFLLLLPAYCLLSTLWSDYPQTTLRYSIQVSITLAIAVLIASRLSPATLIRCLFGAFALGALFSVLLSLQASGGAWHGMFDSKNAFAAHVAFLLLVALALVLDRFASLPLRALALLTTILCGPLLILAQSTGVLLTIVPCAAAMVLVAASARMSGPQKLFAVCLVMLCLLGFSLFAIDNLDAILSRVLDATGKDPTFTGRTELWSAGTGLIAEHPLLGVGYRAFWVVGNGAAEQLWAMFRLPSGAGFNFHNTYISNTVEIGLVGIALQLCIIYGALLMLVWLSVVRPSSFVLFLLGTQLQLVLRSFIEVEVFTEFSVRSMMAICTFIYAAQATAEWRRQRHVETLRLQPARHDGLEARGSTAGGLGA